MTRQPASIFNDVLGPVMVGPSSSHTAASVRIGQLIRALCTGQPQRVEFFFSRQGSLASCHEPQGTDMGLAAGLLGFEMTDPRLDQACTLAAEQGLELIFTLTDTPVPHPNTYEVALRGGGRATTAIFYSTGGGMIELVELAGIPLSCGSGFYEALLLLDVGSPVEAEQQLNQLTERLPADCRATLCQNKDSYLIHIQGEQQPQPALWQDVPTQDVFLLEPVLPVRARHSYSGLFHTAEEVLELTRAENLALWQVAARYEALRGGLTETEVFSRMRDLLGILRQTITKVEQHQKDYADRILGPQAHLLKDAPQLPNQTLNAAIQRITLLMEAKSSMEVIVAAPTAGSCAALPGTVIGVAESLGLGEEAMTRALLAAGMVGVLLAEHSTFAAEVAGCQAECGSGSGMAAAALVELLGGSAGQALDAASMALQNIFGLVCDPVAGRVEVPCLGKNILAGSNAISMANLALAGFDAVIPLDQTIEALYAVGRKIDASLRCTCLGGLSLTPASLEVEKRLQG